jgi:hypothetical protein
MYSLPPQKKGMQIPHMYSRMCRGRVVPPKGMAYSPSWEEETGCNLGTHVSAFYAAMLHFQCVQCCTRGDEMCWVKCMTGVYVETGPFGSEQCEWQS